jgi:hypothetical protein
MKKETSYNRNSNNSSLSIEDVIISSLKKPQFEEIIIELLDGNELYYYVLQAHFDLNVNYTFPESIINDLMVYFQEFRIEDSGDYIESSATMYSADLAAYPPDGSWNADLYEFLDHYMWSEPEGEKYGFFNDLETARRFGDKNWIPEMG